MKINHILYNIEAHNKYARKYSEIHLEFFNNIEKQIKKILVIRIKIYK
jgi:hypothetical protein